MSEATHSVSQVHIKLAKVLGIDGKARLMEIFLDRVIRSLKTWADWSVPCLSSVSHRHTSEEVVRDSIKLFRDLCFSQEAARQLLKVP